MAAVDFSGYKRFVQYFYDPEPKADNGSKAPIWCLGQRYSIDEKPALKRLQTPRENNGDEPEATGSFHVVTPATPPDSASDDASSSNNGEADLGWPIAFLNDFESRIWLTYRSGFPAIARSQDSKATAAMTFAVRLRNIADKGFTSDTGFGCMIRSGQSLLANALIVAELGRGWRYGQVPDKEKAILSFFADDVSAPFSIHRFIQHGAIACGTHPGEWFGPSATASCIQELANSDLNTSLRVYVTGDGSDVYEDSFMSVAKQNYIFKPTLILVGIRLGIEKVTEAYHGALTATLQIPQSIGIAGGRPSASHYFVASQGSNLFYLDPHTTKPALPLREPPSALTDAEVASCHTRRLRMIHVKEMDPSMLIGFLIQDEEDWVRWRTSIAAMPGKCIIHVSDKFPALHGSNGGRAGAIDEVESFDDCDDADDDDTILVEN